MILNIDLNPYIKKNYRVNKIKLDKHMKSDSSIYTLGGSVVISEFLRAFNENSFLTGFLGGINGQRYHNMLLERNLGHEFIQIKEETAEVVRIIDDKNNINIIGEEPRITREEIVKFLMLYNNLIRNSKVVSGSGLDLAIGLPKEIYYDLITLANENGKRFILQTQGEELKYGIEANPYMVILDKEILGDLINIELQYENEIIKGSRYIRDRGVEFLVIAMPNNEILFLGQDKGFRISSDSINTLINVDKDNLRNLVAAFSLGINRNYDLEMTLRLAYAFNIYDEKNLYAIEVSDIKKNMSEVEIITINYN